MAKKPLRVAATSQFPGTFNDRMRRHGHKEQEEKEEAAAEEEIDT